MKTGMHFWSHLAQFFLEREMFKTKIWEKMKTHHVRWFPLENCADYDIMWKNIVERGRAQATIWRMRFVCWITKATDTQHTTHTQTHTLTHTHSHTQTHTHTHSHSHTQTQTHAHTHTHTHTQIHTHTHTHSHTHTTPHTLTNSHSHSHTHNMQYL